MLVPGFYVLEKGQLQRHLVASPRDAMSVLAFLRVLRHNDPLLREVLVTGLDRMLYQMYRLHGEGEIGKRAVRQGVNVLSRALYNPQARQRLLIDAPVVLFVLEYVEHGERWRAGVRIRRAIGDEPLELFWLDMTIG